MTWLWLRILLLIYLSCWNLSCNWFGKHGKSSLQYLIWIFICRMIDLWICCMNFHMTYKEFLVHCYWDMSYDLNFKGYDNLTQMQLWKTLLFLHLIPFRDVSMAKKPKWSNLDIRRQSLVHTTVVTIWLWVFNFSLDLKYSYFRHPIVSMWLK
jgi:hypothetical protein